ncbi:MAG TPA: D-alanyl-D-alanine carboxypeptidase family protein [Solirubrobacteraceae bacterium]|nr:D-alanyl-D-alanine carboxypeptidase family protein [Solirubrobacteraceae bacterium]
MTAALRALAIAVLAVALLPAAAGAEAKPPRCEVDASSAIVIEVSTGAVACATNPDERRSIASTTKLMTALLTLERAKLSDTFTAADYMPSAAESKIGLDRGERMSVRDLMRGLLVESANDAAVTLAEGVSGSRRAFVRAMNRRAQQLKLTNTHYANPIGLDEQGNYSSARDLVRLAVVLRTNHFFRTTTDRPSVRLTTGNGPRTFDNRNTLVRSTGWINGVKSGHTSQAGYVLVGSGRRNGIQLVSAVLGTPSLTARNAESLKVLEDSFPAFQRITAVRKGTIMTRVPIKYRRGAELALVAGRTVRRIVPRGQRDDVTSRVVGRPDDVTGPILAGQSFGAVEILQKGHVVGRVPLVAASSVPEADLEQKAKSWFTSPLPLLLVVAVIAGTVLVGRQIRRTARNGRRAGDRPRAA